VPEPIQTPIQAQALADFFQIKGGLDLQLDDIIVPVVVVGSGAPLTADDPGQGSGEAAAGSVTATLVPAQFGHVQLFNPVDSGKIITPTRVTISAGAAIAGDLCRVVIFDTPLATLVGAIGSAFVDRRAVGRPVAELRFESAVATFGTNFVLNRRITANETQEFPLSGDWTLEEGNGILVSLSRVGIQVTGSFQWGERAA